MDTSFWDRTNVLIKKLNKTQSSVSVECGFNPRRIQNLSGSNRLPDAAEAYKIAQVLHTTVEYLVSGNDTDSTKKINETRNLLLNVIKNLDHIS